MNIRPFIIAASLLAGAAFSGASAQVQVIGSSVGKDCFQAVKFNLSSSNSQIRTCTEAIKSGTLNRRDLAATLMNRGIAKMRGKDYIAALQDYSDARDIRPSMGAIDLNAGAALIGSGRPAEAIPLLKRSLELETQDPHMAYYNLGLAYDLTGDVESAYYAFKDALELKPDWELAQTQLQRYSVVSEG